MTVKHKVSGELAQVITCQLDPEQALFADAGKFLWKTSNVSIETRLTAPAGGDEPAKKSGSMLQAALATAAEVGKRALAGQSLAFQWFRPAGGSGLVAFAGITPGQVKAIELDGGVGWYAERNAFVCAEASITFDIAFTGLAKGRKGGEGFVLERFGGTGTLMIAGGGSLVELDPAAYGGKIQVHAGAVAAFADTVSFGVERVGALNAQTAMTALFGGQGFNLVTLTGQGPVVLQATTHHALEAEEDRDDRGRGGGLLDRL
jgi:uncharacterized protein (AIM24 family)